jgi:ArsR family transcriptional regulator
MQELHECFKGLADATRVRIVNLLLQGELCGCDLQRVLGLAQPNVSRHLTYLKNCGLVADRRAGYRVFYRLRDSQPGPTREMFGFLERVFRRDPLLLKDKARLRAAMQAGQCAPSEGCELQERPLLRASAART